MRGAIRRVAREERVVFRGARRARCGALCAREIRTRKRRFAICDCGNLARAARGCEHCDLAVTTISRAIRRGATRVAGVLVIALSCAKRLQIGAAIALATCQRCHHESATNNKLHRELDHAYPLLARAGGALAL